MPVKTEPAAPPARVEPAAQPPAVKGAVFDISAAATQAMQAAQWAEAVKAAGGEEADLYNQGRSDVAAGRFDDGAKTLGRLIEKFPQSSLRGEAMWLRAAAILATGDHYAAFEQLEALITQYAGSPHYRDALKNEIQIGEAFLGGVHRKIWGMTSPMLGRVGRPGDPAEGLRARAPGATGRVGRHEGGRPLLGQARLGGRRGLLRQVLPRVPERPVGPPGGVAPGQVHYRILPRSAV